MIPFCHFTKTVQIKGQIISKDVPIFHNVSSPKNEYKIDQNINHEVLITVRVNVEIQFLVSLLEKWHDEIYLLKFSDL